MFTPCLVALLLAAPNPRELDAARAHRGPVTELGFTPDGRTLVSVDGEGTVVRWDVAAGKPAGTTRLGPFPDHAFPQFAVSPTGRHVGVGASVGPLRVYDAATGAVVATVPRPLADADAWYPVFSGDGRRVAYGYYRGHGSPTPGPVAVPVWDVVRDRAAGTVEVPLPPGGIVTTRLALSSDGTRLAAAIAPAPGPKGDTGVELGVWDVPSGRRVATRQLSDEAATDLTFIPGARALLVHRPAEVAAWEPEMDKWRATVCRWNGFGRPVFAPDGRSFAAAVGLFDRTIKGPRVDVITEACTVFETATVAERGPVLRSHPSLRGFDCWAVVINRGGRLLAVTNGDVISLFDLTNSIIDSAPVWGSGGLDKLWVELAGSPSTAGRAIRLLAARPAAAVALFREKLSPAGPPPLDAPAVAKLIARLDAPAFADREAAAKQLAAAVRHVEPQLRAAHAAATSPEQRERLAALIARVDKPAPEDLRLIRAVETLEKIDTPAAVDLLRRIAGGEADALLTREARATLGRVAK